MGGAGGAGGGGGAGLGGGLFVADNSAGGAAPAARPCSTTSPSSATFGHRRRRQLRRAPRRRRGRRWLGGPGGSGAYPDPRRRRRPGSGPERGFGGGGVGHKGAGGAGRFRRRRGSRHPDIRGRRPADRKATAARAVSAAAGAGAGPLTAILGAGGPGRLRGAGSGTAAGRGWRRARRGRRHFRDGRRPRSPSRAAALLGTGTVSGSGGGQGLGGGLFLEGNETITLAPVAGTVETIIPRHRRPDRVGAGAGSSAGAGSLILDGLGTLDLDAANTFTGGVTIDAGVLELANASAAGSGGIDFASTTGGEIEYRAAGATVSPKTPSAASGVRTRLTSRRSPMRPATRRSTPQRKVSIETSAGKTVAMFNVTGIYASDNFDVGQDASGHVLVTDPRRPRLLPPDVLGAHSLADLLGQPGSNGDAHILDVGQRPACLRRLDRALARRRGRPRRFPISPMTGIVGRSALDFIAGSGGTTDDFARAMSHADHWGRLMS